MEYLNRFIDYANERRKPSRAFMEYSTEVISAIEEGKHVKHEVPFYMLYDMLSDYFRAGCTTDETVRDLIGLFDFDLEWTENPSLN